MADIELDNIGEDRTEQGEAQRAEQVEEWEEEETSFTENENNNGDHDDSALVIDDSNPEFTPIADLGQIPCEVGVYKRHVTYDQKDFLKKALGVTLNKGAGPKSKELFNNLRVTLDSKGEKINGAEYDGEKILVLRNGKIEYSLNRAYVNDIIDFKKLLEKAKEEYNASIASVINESVDASMSDEAVESVQDTVIEELESFIDDKYNELSLSDPEKNIEREINEIMHVDDDIDYDDLSDPNQSLKVVSK